MSALPLIEAREVTRTYTMGADTIVRALDGVSFEVDHGDHVAIIGSSGSGKSTLLNLLGALDRPTSGTIAFNGGDVRDLSTNALAQLRNQTIGFVFQSFHLLPRMSALANVELPLLYRNTSPRARRRLALAALEDVGLANRSDHRPTELSGGQQQRVAIARALVTKPALLLADEPTGNLDSTTGEQILELLEQSHREHDMALVIITHEREVAVRADRQIELRDGRIVGEASVR